MLTIIAIIITVSFVLYFSFIAALFIAATFFPASAEREESLGFQFHPWCMDVDVVEEDGEVFSPSSAMTIALISGLQHINPARDFEYGDGVLSIYHMDRFLEMKVADLLIQRGYVLRIR